MRDLWAVVLDLWGFCTGQSSSVQPAVALPPVTRAATVINMAPAAVTAVASPAPSYDLSFESGVIAYVAASEVACTIRAVHSFDGILARLPYGTAVIVGRRIGHFVEIVAADVTGWVPFAAITRDEKRIFPVCVSGEVYDGNHATTRSIRLLLQDAFAAQPLSLPLTAEEFVTYQLRLLKLSIAWPAVRPRLAGSWHHYLRGVRGIHIGIEPKTGAVMEWTAEGGVGHLAVVEAVQPDETIQIIGIGLEVEGKCTRLTMAPDVWCEWRPVFILVS